MLEYARTSGVSIRVQLIEAELAHAALIEVYGNLDHCVFVEKVAFAFTIHIGRLRSFYVK